MEEREALQEDAELVALKKEQLEMKHAIKLQYGALTKAPEDQKLAYRDIYNDYQAREALLYKQVSPFALMSRLSQCDEGHGPIILHHFCPTPHP